MDNPPGMVILSDPPTDSSLQHCIPAAIASRRFSSDRTMRTKVSSLRRHSLNRGQDHSQDYGQGEQFHGQRPSKGQVLSPDQSQISNQRSNISSSSSKRQSSAYSIKRFPASSCVPQQGLNSGTSGEWTKTGTKTGTSSVSKSITMEETSSTFNKSGQSPQTLTSISECPESATRIVVRGKPFKSAQRTPPTTTTTSVSERAKAQTTTTTSASFNREANEQNAAVNEQPIPKRIPPPNEKPKVSSFINKPHVPSREHNAKTETIDGTASTESELSQTDDQSTNGEMEITVNVLSGTNDDTKNALIVENFRLMNLRMDALETRVTKYAERHNTGTIDVSQEKPKPTERKIGEPEESTSSLKPIIRICEIETSDSIIEDTSMAPGPSVRRSAFPLKNVDKFTSIPKKLKLRVF